MTAKDGKPCRKCGNNEWYKNGDCSTCRKESSRKWRMNHPEQEAASRRRYRQANPDKVAESRRRYIQANPEKNAERRRRYIQANPEKEAERHRRYKRENREKVREVIRKWEQQHPGSKPSRNHRRRTRQTAAGGSYTAAEWNALLEHYGNKCLCCGRAGVKLTADHVVPVVKGGTSNIDNIQPLCGRCNSSKQDKIIDYRPDKGAGRWIQRRLFG